MLPDCDELFLRYFDPWYTQAWRDLRGFEATRPDMYTIKTRGRAAADLSPLVAEGRAEAAQMVERMIESAIGDWPTYLDVAPPVTIEWVRKVDEYFDRQRITSLIEESSPDDFSNAYLVTCCQWGAVLGEVLRQEGPDLEWVYSWPYWESSLVHLPSGNVVPVFHWAIKKMSEYGVDDGFAAKIRACCQILKDESRW